MFVYALKVRGKQPIRGSNARGARPKSTGNSRLTYSLYSRVSSFTDGQEHKLLYVIIIINKKFFKKKPPKICPYSPLPWPAPAVTAGR